MNDCINIPDPTCATKNPLLRTGSSQADRGPEALWPDQLQIDDRSIEEILIYAYKLAERIQYFNVNNDPDQSWQQFFEFDEGSLLTILVAKNLSEQENQFLKLKSDLLADQHTPGREEQVPIHFRKIINFIYKDFALDLHNLLERLDDLPIDIPQIQAFKKEIFKVIEEEIVGAILDNKVQNALIKLIGYDKGNPIKLNELDEDKAKKYEPFIETLSHNRANVKIWKIDKTCYYCINADGSYNLERVTDLYQIFYKTFRVIQDKARAFLNVFLKRRAEYLPHIALFFTFLRLFDLAREELNGLSRKHLTYYYERILCQKKKLDKADKVHVIFELAKNFDQHKVAAGTQFVGGKDKNGQNRIYELVNEIVLNKTEVAELKTIYINEDIDQAPGELLRAYASTNALMRDGQEQPFGSPEETRFSALGGRLHSPQMPASLADIGFAIASPMLYLQEGHRTVYLDLEFAKAVPVPALNVEANDNPAVNAQAKAAAIASYFKDKFKLEISTADGWLPIEEYKDEVAGDLAATFQVQNSREGAQNLQPDKTIYLEITLEKTAPPIEPLPVEEGKNDFPTTWPILKVSLSNDAETEFPYRRLRDIPLRKLTIRNDVDDVRNLQVFNDQSQLDPTKDFFPFGVEPKAAIGDTLKGSRFYIGNKEVFSKSLSTLRLNFNWADLPSTSFPDHYAAYADDVAAGDGDENEEEEATAIRNNEDFEAKIALLHDKEFYWPESNSEIIKLFVEEGQTTLQSEVKVDISIPVEPDGVDKPNEYEMLKKRHPSIIKSNLKDPKSANFGYCRLELNNVDFLHAEYPKALIRRSLQLADDPTVVLPNPPYTPTLSGISLDYESELVIDFKDKESFGVSSQGVEQFFHLLPFGFKALDVEQEIHVLAAEENSNGSSNAASDGEEPVAGVLIVPQFEPPLRTFALETGTYSFKPLPEEETNVDTPLPANPNFITASGLLRGQIKPGVAALGYKGIPQLSVDLTKSLLVSSFTSEVGKFDPKVPEIKKAVAAEESYHNTMDHMEGDEGRPWPIAIDKEERFKILNAKRRTQLSNGNLFIGLDQLEPPQSVSILFQALEGSGDPRFSPPEIAWSYLVDNEWREFSPRQIILDTTNPDPQSRNSLLKAGVITFAIPRDISRSGTTILNPTYYWLRASTIPISEQKEDLPQSPAALPYLVNVKAQAGEAVFVKSAENSLEHLDTALPPKTISKLFNSQPQVKKVEQPYSSFSGRPQEKDREFYRRVSERLRHKGRGISVWDLEHLVLEAFPSIYKAKCLNHTSYGSEVDPGHITIAVIPNFRDNNNLNPLEPRAHLGLLREVEVYLRKVTNLFMTERSHLRVVSPFYEKIRVVCCVRFKEGKDEKYYQRELSTDIRRHLAPWAKEEMENPQIILGVRTHRAHILNFIEERDYVDVVSRMALLHFDGNGAPVPYFDKEDNQLMPEQIEEIIPTTSLSILTSYEKRLDETDFEYDHIVLVTPRDAQSTGDEACHTCP